MKKLLFVILLMGALCSHAQDKTRPWAIGLGINTVDISHYGVSNLGDQIFNDYIGPFKDTNTFPFLSRVYVARYLNKSLTLDLNVAYNKLKKQFGESETLDDVNFLSGDIGVRYDVNNIIGETGWFDPYVKVGGGLAIVNGSDMSLPLLGALGFNAWFNDKYGLNFETNYKSSSLFGDSNIGELAYVGDYFFQHSISFVYKFGAKDTDKDGVSDKEDLCPEIPGSKELYGCPDKDGDGVIDIDDKCPDIVGSKENLGCPVEKDTDGDGVVDKKDVCPMVAGSKSSSGCPDSDNDGVPDQEDMCPKVKGLIGASGCPDSDHDGVPDYLDKCPKVAGQAEFDGCSESEVLKLTDSDADSYLKSKGDLLQTIQFKFGAVAIEYKVQQELDKIVDVLLADTSTVAGLYVEGHTDSVGAAAFNMKLSIKRAKSIVEYFVDNGVERSRLRIIGYGETTPIATNATREGRAKNRRVEVSVLLLSRK